VRGKGELDRLQTFWLFTSWRKLVRETGTHVSSRVSPLSWPYYVFEDRERPDGGGLQVYDCHCTYKGMAEVAAACPLKEAQIGPG